MNDDHMDSTIQMIYDNIPGMQKDPSNVITEAEKAVQYLPQPLKLRLPFPRRVFDRKDVTNVIVEMLLVLLRRINQIIIFFWTTPYLQMFSIAFSQRHCEIASRNDH
jgi:hypothetical protein